jgi:hypothetical protein
MMGIVLVCVLILSVYLLIWSLVAPALPACALYSNTNLNVCSCTVDSNSSFFSPLLLAIEGFCLLFGVYLCLLTRKIPSMFNESKHIAAILYTSSVLAVVSVPLSLSGNHPEFTFVVRAIAPTLVLLVRLFCRLFSPFFFLFTPFSVLFRFV